MRCNDVLGVGDVVVAGGRSLLTVTRGVVFVTVAVAKGFPAESFSTIVCYSFALIIGDIVIAALLGVVVVAVHVVCLGGDAV